MRTQLSSIAYVQSRNGGSITFAEGDALSNLVADNAIAINRADKAKVVVIQNHTDYACDQCLWLSLLLVHAM